MFDNDKDKMHPEDTRNLLIFFLLAAVIYFAYDAMILAPQKQAMTQAQIVEEQIATTLASEEEENGIQPREEVLASAERITIDNGEIFGSISLTGGRIDDIALYKFYETLDKEQEVVLLSPKSTAFPRYIDYGWVAAEEGIKLPGPKTRWRVRGNDKITADDPVTLIWNNGQGLVFERIISLDKSYLFKITQKVTNNSGKDVTLYPYGLVTQTGIPKNLQDMWLQHEGPIGYIGEQLEEIDYKHLRQGNAKTLQASQGWIGVTDKYWLTSLIPAQGQNTKYRFQYTGLRNDKNNKGRYQVDYTGAPLVLKPGESGQSASHLFTGAKKVLLLQEYQDQTDAPHFDLAVNFGWFWFLSKPFFYILHFLGEYVGNMGVAIILLTILIRSAVFPLTNTSYKSFAKMKKVTPQIVELRAAYGDDKAKLQQELVKLYEREGVNPMAGCFPILLQIPIFFALYKVLFVTIEIRHAPFVGWIQDLSAPDPTSIFNLFGLIPWDPPGFLQIGAWPCVMLVAMIIQRKLNPPPQDPIQRDMANYFPFIITFILSGFAAGLVIYWACSAIIGLIQQMIIMHRLGVPIHLFGQTAEEEQLEAAISKGPDVHPLAEMVEEEVEEAMFGEHDEEERPKKISPPKPKKKKKKKK